MKMYTRTGDKGDTGLYDGARVSKDNVRVEAYGAIDELNAQIGLARAQIQDDNLNKILVEIQKQLFTLGGELATRDLEQKRIPKITMVHVEKIEEITDKLNDSLPALRRFILPGGTVAGSQLHVARTVCRRAERRLVALSRLEPISPILIPYMNRLSSLLFVMARSVNMVGHMPEQEWVHE